MTPDPLHKFRIWEAMLTVAPQVQDQVYNDPHLEFDPRLGKDIVATRCRWLAEALVSEFESRHGPC